MNKYIVKKELKESFFANKGIWMIVAVSVIMSSLCFVFVNIKEGSVLAQNDILQYAIKVSMFLTLIVSIVLGSSSFISEREENTLEGLLLTPISKLNLTLAKYISVIIIGIILYLVCIPYLIAIAVGSNMIISSILLMLFIGILLLISFVAISIAISILMKSSKSSIISSIIILLIIAVPAFLKSLLKASTVGMLVMKTNPVSCGFNMMSKILTEQVSIFTLWNLIIPLIAFAIISILFLIFTTNRIALKEEK
jgi:ABC-2 type transport system permease protein